MISNFRFREFLIFWMIIYPKVKLFTKVIICFLIILKINKHEKKGKQIIIKFKKEETISD